MACDFVGHARMLGARHRSEAICPNARQSQESWRTPYCQTEPRRGALWAGEGWLTPVAGMRALTVAARIGASRPSTFMSRTRECSPAFLTPPSRRGVGTRACRVETRLDTRRGRDVEVRSRHEWRRGRHECLRHTGGL